jgi:hypothetical protein
MTGWRVANVLAAAMLCAGCASYDFSLDALSHNPLAELVRPDWVLRGEVRLPPPGHEAVQAELIQTTQGERTLPPPPQTAFEMDAEQAALAEAGLWTPEPAVVTLEEEPGRLASSRGAEPTLSETTVRPGDAHSAMALRQSE